MFNAINLALAGDVMLGRMVNEAIPRRGLWGAKITSASRNRGLIGPLTP
jgi:hypothetical protein